MNICTILTGSRGHDLPCKLAWAKPLEQKGHNVFIVGRTKQQDIISMYGDPHTVYRLSLQQDMEKWLGVPYSYIGTLDWRTFNRQSHTDTKNTEQVNQYLTFLTIWFQHFYITNKIDALVFIFESFPWNLIAYYVARKMGIPVINIMGTRFPKRGIMLGDNGNTFIHNWNNNPDPEWEEITSLYQERTFNKIKGVGLSNFWSPQNLQNNLSKALQYIKTQKSMSNISPYEKTALPPLWGEIDKVIWSTLKSFTNPIFWEKVRDEEYFFYPFHLEDDANVSLAEPFTSQVELIKGISRSLPVNVKLYIKPHPVYKGADMRIKDLLTLSELKNVRIIDPSVSSVSVINKAIGLITLNSTAGFEAMILNKPVISLGHDFYCHPNLLYLVREWHDLPKTILEVYKERKPLASTETVELFAKFIYKNTIFTQGDVAYAEDPFTPSDGERIAFAIGKICGKLLQ